MKGKILGLVWGLALTGALYPQARLAPPNAPNAVARQGESEIVINGTNVEKDIAVWVNDAIVAHVFQKTTEKIIVRDGRNIVHLAETTPKGGVWNIGDKKQVVVDSVSNRVTIRPLMRYGRLINTEIQQTIAISPRPRSSEQGSLAAARALPAPEPVQTFQPARNPEPVAVRNPEPVQTPRPQIAADTTIEGAVYRAAEELIQVLPRNSTLAIISIASRDRDMSDFVIEELAYLLVETRKFKIVDRKSLDAIRAEQDFQFSGEVDDNSAVSIGKMLGASIVITGSISGSGATRRLRAKALDVKTAEIMAMASERF
ncbi:MAG: CsgG/HfaB family protein [Treponema sp.]|jgi:TolB-like protein|nr:CsgG/HfaB family protein [Treponema sp.]